MTEAEFLKKIVESQIQVYYPKKMRDWSLIWTRRDKRKNAKTKITLEDSLRNEWCSGGISGGNCWEEGGHYSIEGESESDFVDLDSLLSIFCPNITYLKYKELYALSKVDWRVQNEYYGNETRYSSRTIKLQEIYDFLLRENLL